MNRRGKAKRKNGGTDNARVDLGFADAEDLSVRTMLAVKLNKLIERIGLTQAAASRLLGMPQPKISAICNYKLQAIRL